MSLIEEALRKHRAESTPAPAPAPAPAPVAPHPVAPPPLPPEPGATDKEGKPASGRPWGALLLILLLLLLAVAVGGWFAFRSGLHLFGRADAEPQPAEPPATASGEEPLAAPETATQEVAEAVQALEPQPLPAPSGADVAAVNTAAPAVAPEAKPATSAPAAALPPAQPAAKPVVAPKAVPPTAPKEPVAWPRLTITGLIGAGQRGGVAIINGQTVSVGDTVEGVKVTAVVQQTVRLSYQGETKLLRVGDATE